jgi:hypothetical protein
MNTLCQQRAEISLTPLDRIRGPPSVLYNGYWLSYPGVLATVSSLHSVSTFIPDSARLMTSMLSARAPVVRYSKDEEDFYMMGIVYRRLGKELKLDLICSVRPIKS